jgi:hypothetical protein
MADVDGANIRTRIRVVGNDGRVTGNNNGGNTASSSSGSVFTEADNTASGSDNGVTGNNEAAAPAVQNEPLSYGRMIRRNILDFRMHYGEAQNLTSNVPLVSTEQSTEWGNASTTAQSTANTAANTHYTDVTTGATATYNATKPGATSALTAAQDAEKGVVTAAAGDTELAGALDTLVERAKDDPKTPDVDEGSADYIAKQNGLHAVTDSEGKTVYMDDTQYAEYESKQKETKAAQAALDTVEDTYNAALDTAETERDAARAAAQDQHDAEDWAAKVADGTDAYDALTGHEVNARMQFNVGQGNFTGFFAEAGYNPGGNANFMLGVDQGFLLGEQDEFGTQVKGGMNTNGTGLLGLQAEWNHAFSDKVSLGIEADALGALKYQHESFGNVNAESWQGGIVYGGALSLNYRPTDSISLTGYGRYSNSAFWNEATAGDSTYSASSNGGNGALTFGAKGEVGLGGSGFSLLGGVSDQVNLNNGEQNWQGFFGIGFKK